MKALILFFSLILGLSFSAQAKPTQTEAKAPCVTGGNCPTAETQGRVDDGYPGTSCKYAAEDPDANAEIIKNNCPPQVKTQGSGSSGSTKGSATQK